MKKIRLDKFISDSTSYSRKDASMIIKSGEVSVNGTIIKDTGYKVDKETDTVFLKNEQITHKDNYYIMMNKPAGYLSATEDRYQSTVLELLDESIPKSKIFPAGRLDKDTEGFLFLTTDGPLAHRVTGPKNHVPKKYYVEVDGKIESELITAFKEGITLENDEECKSADLEILSEKTCYLTITEGKFHQVKRMFKMFSLNVVYLKRMSIGSLTLDENLKPGEYRELTDDEVLKICLKK